jgi:hypothetical protein
VQGNVLPAAGLRAGTVARIAGVVIDFYVNIWLFLALN